MLFRSLARDLKLRGVQDLDEDEFLDVVRVPFEEAVAMVMRDELPDAKTQLAILKTAEFLRNE